MVSRTHFFLLNLLFPSFPNPVMAPPHAQRPKPQAWESFWLLFPNPHPSSVSYLILFFISPPKYPFNPNICLQLLYHSIQSSYLVAPLWLQLGPRHSSSIPGEGNGNLLQYSSLENPMDRGAWWATVHGVTKSQTQLSNWAHSSPIEKVG